jgi:hypothetical protein
VATGVEDGLALTNPCTIKGAGTEPKPETEIPTVAEVHKLATASTNASAAWCSSPRSWGSARASCSDFGAGTSTSAPRCSPSASSARRRGAGSSSSVHPRPRR